MSMEIKLPVAESAARPPLNPQQMSALQATLAPFTPEPLFDIPSAVYAFYAAGWAALLLVYAWTFRTNSLVLFVLTFIGFYAVMFFAVPAALAVTGPRRAKTVKSVMEFLDSRMPIADGNVTGREAVIQVLTVPFVLAIGAFAISFIVAAARTAHVSY